MLPSDKYRPSVVGDSVLEGVFVTETKNRFHCIVFINGQAVDCYVPSSCRLSNFLSLDGKTVLLIPTANTKAKARYALLAVNYKGKCILLNTVMTNRIVEQQIGRRFFSSLGKRKHIQREQIIDSYKFDLYVGDTDTAIEIKSIIATASTTEAFSINSERAVSQLMKISERLKANKSTAYVFAILSPFVKKLIVNKKTACGNLLARCCEMGLKLICVSIAYDNRVATIKRSIPLEFVE